MSPQTQTPPTPTARLTARLRSARFYKAMYAQWPGKQGRDLYERYAKLVAKMERELVQAEEVAA